MLNTSKIAFWLRKLFYLMLKTCCLLSAIETSHYEGPRILYRSLLKFVIHRKLLLLWSTVFTVLPMCYKLRKHVACWDNYWDYISLTGSGDCTGSMSHRIRKSRRKRSRHVSEPFPVHAACKCFRVNVFPWQFLYLQRTYLRVQLNNFLWFL